MDQIDYNYVALNYYMSFLIIICLNIVVKSIFMMDLNEWNGVACTSRIHHRFLMSSVRSIGKLLRQTTFSHEYANARNSQWLDCIVRMHVTAFKVKKNPRNEGNRDVKIVVPPRKNLTAFRCCHISLAHCIIAGRILGMSNWKCHWFLLRSHAMIKIISDKNCTGIFS